MERVISFDNGKLIEMAKNSRELSKSIKPEHVAAVLLSTINENPAN